MAATPSPNMVNACLPGAWLLPGILPRWGLHDALGFSPVLRELQRRYGSAPAGEAMFNRAAHSSISIETLTGRPEAEVTS